MPSPVVDMRSRPSFLHPFFGAAPGTPEEDVVRWLNRQVGSNEVDHFTRGRSIDGFVAEMNAARISVAIMVARSVPGVRVGNDDLAAAAQHDPARLVGIASVDPVELGRDAAVAEARRAVTELGMKGVNLDAGFYGEAMRADDERLMPLYELCQELGVPAFIMSGPTTPDLRLNDPYAVDRVAKTFPDLPLVCCHGFYPHAEAIVTVAFRNANVYVSPCTPLAGWPIVCGGGQWLHARPCSAVRSRPAAHRGGDPYARGPGGEDVSRSAARVLPRRGGSGADCPGGHGPASWRLHPHAEAIVMPSQASAMRMSAVRLRRTCTSGSCRVANCMWRRPMAPGLGAVWRGACFFGAPDPDVGRFLQQPAQHGISGQAEDRPRWLRTTPSPRSAVRSRSAQCGKDVEQHFIDMDR